MRRLLPLLSIAGAILLSSCGANKAFKSSVLPSEITDLAIFEPISHISYIERGNYGEFNDSLSFESRKMTTRLIQKVRGLPEDAQILSFEDEVVINDIENEISAFHLSMLNAKKKARKDVVVPSVVLDVLAANGYRFGMITASSGFTRRKGNYGGQMAMGVGLGILTGVYVTPIKFSSSLSCIIIDAENGNVAFYKNSYRQDTDPMHIKTISDQLNDIFEGYLYPFPANRHDYYQ